MATLSLGVLAALINITTLFVVAVADRSVEFIVRNFAVARLRKTTRAPVLHDSDVWLPNIPRSILKYRNYPAILLTLLCAILLVGAELITELGMDVRKNCGPELEEGPVISAADSSSSVTDVELGASSFFIQDKTFLGQSLNEVRAGFPRHISNSTCIKCLTEGPQILKNCSVKEGENYEKGRIGINVISSTGSYGTETSSFYDIENDKTFSGDGDLTNNTMSCGTFLFFTHKPSKSKPKESLRVTYFEYADRVHCRHLLDRARDEKPDPVYEKTNDMVRTFDIECYTEWNDSTDALNLDLSSFSRALRGYRSMHLENTIHPAFFNETESRFQNLTEDDVYRAVLSLKIMDDINVTGTYQVYKECGTYKYEYIVPFVAVLAVIAILGIVSKVILYRVGDVDIPHNSSSWFNQAHGQRQSVQTEAERKNERWSYFNISPDEFVLDMDEGNGYAPQVHIERSNETNRDGNVFDGVGAGPRALSSVRRMSLDFEGSRFSEHRNRQVPIQQMAAPTALFSNRRGDMVDSVFPQ